MKGNAWLSLEGELDFTRDRNRVSLVEGTACEKHTGMKRQAQEAVKNKLGPECVLYMDGMEEYLKSRRGMECEGIKNSDFRLS